MTNAFSDSALRALRVRRWELKTDLKWAKKKADKSAHVAGIDRRKVDRLAARLAEVEEELGL